MRSAELAVLAGVTVRTLRHYHQVGILPEAARGANGYRRYGVHDLIRLLRIRRLSSLGVTLDAMPALLDGDAVGADGGSTFAVLDRLDRELEAQAERIAAQRAVIARLRHASGAADVPPELAPFLVTLARAAQSPDSARMDRDQTVLLAHLVGETGMPHLVDFYERLSDPGTLPALTAILETFERLGPDTTPEETERFVDDFVTTLEPIARSLEGRETLTDLTATWHLFDEYARSTFDETQQRALARIMERLEAIESTG